MSLGALITKARTAARLSIQDLSKTTNIPVTLLREMENDNFSKCGGETYARGHLRNIASKLGLDERIFLDLFESEVTAPAKPIRDLLSENNAAMPYQERKQISWKVLAASSIVALLLFGVAQVIFGISSDKPVVTTSPSVSVSESAKPEPTESAAPIVAGQVTVEVSATRGTTWLYVTNDSGTSLFSGQIRKGNSKLFTESKQINLRVGNAGGVDIKVDGKDVGPLGINGEVVNLTYSAR